MDYCICGRVATENHHIFYGCGLRKVSDKYKCMQIKLCYSCHRQQPSGIHGGNRRLDLKLKKESQKQFEKEFGHELFMKLIGRNYLGGEW